MTGERMHIRYLHKFYSVWMFTQSHCSENADQLWSHQSPVQRNCVIAVQASWPPLLLHWWLQSNKAQAVGQSVCHVGDQESRGDSRSHFGIQESRQTIYEFVLVDAAPEGFCEAVSCRFFWLAYANDARRPSVLAVRL